MNVNEACPSHGALAFILVLLEEWFHYFHTVQLEYHFPDYTKGELEVTSCFLSRAAIFYTALVGYTKAVWPIYPRFQIISQVVLPQQVWL